MRTKLLAALVAALALSAMLLPGGASAQRAARQGNDNASGGQTKSKRVVGVRSSDTGNGSRVTITADDTLKDYSAYRSGDRFYVVLPKSAAGARGGGSGKGYSDMQVQQRGDSVVLSYRVQPGAKPRVSSRPRPPRTETPRRSRTTRRSPRPTRTPRRSAASPRPKRPRGLKQQTLRLQTTPLLSSLPLRP
jgi:hypothetical protein